MKIKIYELLGEVKDKFDNIPHVKYFDRLNGKEDVMWACKENIIYKLDNSNIELNDEVEIIEEKKKTLEEEFEEYYKNKKIEKVYHCAISSENKEIEFVLDNINFMVDKINEIIDYLDYLKSKGEE